MDCIEVSIVGFVLNLDVGVGGGRRLGLRLVAEGRKEGQLGLGKEELRGGEGKVETACR